MTRTLAMECAFLRDTDDLPSTFGFDVAVTGFTDALLRYGAWDRYLFFHPPGWSPDKRSALRAKARLGVEVRLEPTTRIPSYVSRGEITAWFQPDTTTEPVNYRALYNGKPFPFSTPIHMAWGPRLLRTQFLWLLLDPFAPCDSFICTSRAVQRAVRQTLDYMADEMRDHHGATLRFRGRLDVLPLGIDTSRFAPRPKPALRRELGWPQEAFVLLWLGRFSAVDKTDLLPALRMFRRLVQANPRRTLRFVLAGHDRRDIPFLPAIRAFVAGLDLAGHVLIEDDVRACEGAERDRRPALLAAADAFTSPVDNLQETFGITPIEAMACGTPQVISDWDGYKDSTVHGVTGYRIPTYWTSCDTDAEVDAGIGGFGFQGYLWSQTVAVDLRDYEAAVQRLIDDPALCAAMSGASRARALDIFDWARVIGRYEALWEELVATTSRLRPSDVRVAPFLRAALCRRFTSFPTAMLDGRETIALSAEGRRLLAGVDPFPWHSELERHLLDGDVMLAALEAVGGAPGPLAEVATRLTGQTDRRPAIVRTLMWGIKHGLLDCAVSCQPDSAPGFTSPEPEPLRS